MECPPLLIWLIDLSWFLFIPPCTVFTENIDREAYFCSDNLRNGNMNILYHIMKHVTSFLPFTNSEIDQLVHIAIKLPIKILTSWFLPIIIYELCYSLGIPKSSLTFHSFCIY